MNRIYSTTLLKTKTNDSPKKKKKLSIIDN